MQSHADVHTETQPGKLPVITPRYSLLRLAHIQSFAFKSSTYKKVQSKSEVQMIKLVIDTILILRKKSVK